MLLQKMDGWMGSFVPDLYKMRSADLALLGFNWGYIYQAGESNCICCSCATLVVLPYLRFCNLCLREGVCVCSYSLRASGVPISNSCVGLLLPVGSLKLALEILCLTVDLCNCVSAYCFVHVDVWP